MGVVKAFRKELIKFPTRCRKGPRKGQLVWGELTHSQALKVLHQPRYAGAFCYGRTRTRRAPDGRRVHETLPRDRWSVLIAPGSIPRSLLRTFNFEIWKLKCLGACPEDLYSKRRTRATSTGTNTKGTCDGCGKTPALTVRSGAEVRPAKVLPFCRGLPSVLAAADA